MRTGDTRKENLGRLIRYYFLFSLVIPSCSMLFSKTALPRPVVPAPLGLAGVLASGASSITSTRLAAARLAAMPPAVVAALAGEENLAAPTTLDLSELHRHPSEPHRATLDIHKQP
ncbi:MAG: hypothetical protein ABI333_25710 [bacterium]